jgi:hypothetical protein
MSRVLDVGASTSAWSDEVEGGMPAEANWALSVWVWGDPAARS